ncbi:SDR family oxidoreductase [Phytomonospora sp. NPDC050363]|uniref:SDR family NAD(P)-dependent oxidoreductase n=1 Tax=Phytomonospora sp. NPDC050363 TaxID=3155642 RepID=UPI0033E3C490
MTNTDDKHDKALDGEAVDGPPAPEAAPPGEKTHSRTRRRVLAGAVGAGVGLTAGAIGAAAALQGAGTPPVVEPGAARRFEGKVVLITGATSGIGRAAAKLFADEGARVSFCGRREELGREVEREIRDAGGEATYIRADVRVEEDVRAFVEQTVAVHGGLDVCFNNAGISIERRLHEMTAAEWDDVVGTDLRGVFLSMKYQVPHLIERGGGSIVVTSSSNAIATSETRSAYASAKRGLIGLVQAAAHDYAADGIRVNALVPGTTNTDFVRRLAGADGLPDEVWETMATAFGKASIPGLARMATPEEIAAGALLLASGDLPYMTGNQLVLDGGKTARQ